MVTEKCMFLLFLLFLIKCNAEIIFATEVTDITNSMISYSFKDFHCIYFIKDTDTESFILMDTLIKIQIPIVMWVLDKRNYYELKSDAHQCNGYIIVTQTTELLTYLFEENNTSAIIKPHKRTLIFFHGKENIRRSHLEYAAIIRGMDIIIVEGLEQNTSFGFNSLTNSTKLKSKNLRITSLRSNETLISWNYTSNLEFSQQIFKKTSWVPRFKFNSTRYKLKVSSFNYRPYMVGDPKNGVSDGIEYRILKDLIKEWVVEFIVLTETLPGTNQWITTIAEVTKGSSSIALGAHWLHAIEGIDTDMSVPYGRSCATFLVPKSKKIDPSVFVFQPLNLTLWLSLISVSFTVAVSLNMIAVCYRKINMGRHPYVDISLTVLDVISSCATNTMLYLHIAFTRIHLRILLLILCFHSLLFVTVYLTGYASLLTYPRFSKPIRSFEDMVTNKIHWECKNDYYDVALRDSIFVTFNQLADLQDFNKSMKTLNYRIRNNNIAVAVDTVDYGYITETEAFDDYAKKNLKLLKGCFLERYIIMRIIKGSPFTELINTHIARIFETGLVQHWDMEMRHRLGERYLSNFHSELVTELIPRSPLTMENMLGGFYLLFFGYFLATVVFFMECKIFNKIL